MTAQFSIVAPDGKKANITGRDKFVMMHALLYAIAHIQKQHGIDQDKPLLRDICALAQVLGGTTLPYLIENVEYFVGNDAIYLDPDNYPYLPFE